MRYLHSKGTVKVSVKEVLSEHIWSNLDVTITSNVLSDIHLQDQLVTFLEAGHHTIQSALTSPIALLCQHCRIQQRLPADMLSTKSSSQGYGEEEIQSAILNVPYLQASCSKSLRLCPPIVAVRH